MTSVSFHVIHKGYTDTMVVHHQSFNPLMQAASFTLWKIIVPQPLIAGSFAVLYLNTAWTAYQMSQMDAKITKRFDDISARIDSLYHLMSNHALVG